MSIVHLNHIVGELERRVIELVDKSDLDKFPEKERNNMILSRAYALYTLKSFTGLDYESLKGSITDGFHDQGIDAIYWDRRNNFFYIIQSKLINSTKGGPEKGEILKFFEGIRKLLIFDFTDFNEKVHSKKEELNEAFLNSEVKVKLILAHTGTNISPDCQKTIDKNLEELNDADDVIYFEEVNLKDAHRSLTLGVEGNPITAEIDILQWGKNEDPVKSIYGQVNCMFYAETYKNHKLRLFSQNIRGFMGESDINIEIVKSLVNDPSSFVYLNNGITILTKRLQKSAYGGNERTSGHFNCEDITIVNGAQTVGSIYEAYRKNPDQVSKAFVFTRIISLENCPEDFDRKVTVATNTQNKIEKKDFVSLDPEQHRLKTDLLLDNINYVFKRDNSPTKKDKHNLDLEEATISLACLYTDADLSIYAKREISRLWDDTKRAPYRLIFNENLTASKLYKSVLIFRRIETQLKESMWGNNDIQSLILVHGIYLIAHLVFQELDKNLINNPKRVINDEELKTIDDKVSSKKDKVLKSFQQLYPGKFPPTVFKNANYVRSMKEMIYSDEGRIIPGQTLDLFPH
ncbi:MAG: AIPR family protein [Marinoscillum sp.]|uniref:AIPR family protein n=1 Tax=Marinoscillum sp. TaxID=2024838 RepID=UPI003304144E